MRRMYWLLFLCLISTKFIAAQELQLHYDFTGERKYFTGTFEMFKPDRLGNTFMFTDVDFNRADGASLVYFEIARKFNIPNTSLNAHIEYNDGFLITKGASPIGIPIKRAILGGIGFPVKIGNLVVQTSYLYKNIYGSNGLDGQFTAVAMHNLFKNKLTLRGFLDIWSEPLTADKNHKYIVLLTEPQILYNINKTFSVGSEIEISKNFVSRDWKVFPTVMIKWAM